MKNIINMINDLEVGEMLEITQEMKIRAIQEIEKNKQEQAKRDERKKEKLAEDKPLRDGMLEVMTEENERVFKAKELADSVGISTQKATPILKMLAEDGLISRTQGGKSKPFQYQIK